MENFVWNWFFLVKLEILIRIFMFVKMELCYCLKVVDGMSVDYWDRKIVNIIRIDVLGSNEYLWVIFIVLCICLVVNKFLWIWGVKCLWINNDCRLF